MIITHLLSSVPSEYSASLFLHYSRNYTETFCNHSETPHLPRLFASSLKKRIFNIGTITPIIFEDFYIKHEQVHWDKIPSFLSQLHPLSLFFIYICCSIRDSETVAQVILPAIFATSLILVILFFSPYPSVCNPLHGFYYNSCFFISTPFTIIIRSSFFFFCRSTISLTLSLLLLRSHSCLLKFSVDRLATLHM